MAMLLCACTGTVNPVTGGQTGEIAAPICDGPYDPYDLDEVSPIGFSGADVLAELGETHSTTITWSDGVASTLTVRVEHDDEIQDEGNILYVDPMDDHPNCSERADVPIRLTLTTDDGLLELSFVEMLKATETDAATLVGNPSGIQFLGSFDLAAVVGAANLDAVAPHLELTFDGSGSTGEITARRIAETAGEPVDHLVARW